MGMHRRGNAWWVLAGACVLFGSGLAWAREMKVAFGDGVIVTLPVLVAAPWGVTQVSADIMEQTELFFLNELEGLFPEAEVSGEGVGARQVAAETSVSELTGAVPGSRKAQRLIVGELLKMLSRELRAATASIREGLERREGGGEAQARRPRIAVPDANYLLRLVEVSLVFRLPPGLVVRSVEKPKARRRAVAGSLSLVVGRTEARSAQFVHERWRPSVWRKRGSVEAPGLRRVRVQAGRPELSKGP